MTLTKCAPLLAEAKLHLPPAPSEILDITYPSVEQELHWSVYPDSLLLPFASSSLVRLPIKNAQYLCKGEDVKTVIEISLDNKDNAIHFKAGDTIGVLPQNSIEEVDYLIERLNLKNFSKHLYSLSLKNIIGTKKVVIPSHLPLSGSLRDVLISCVDIRSILKKTFIYALSKYAEDPIDRRCLEELCSKEGSHLYTEHVLNSHMNLIDLLNKYKSCVPPITLILQHLPRLMPRPYSICNHFYDNKENIIKFCFSVNEIRQNLKGLATGWMERIVNEMTSQNVNHLNTQYENSHIDLVSTMIQNIDLNSTSVKTLPIYLRKSNSFCLPNDIKKPLIMIALGTGVSPFIGFLSERQNMMNPSDSFGETVLYFGCRYRDKDFIYKKSLEQFIGDGVLTKLRVSHSREGELKAKYVQDNIKQDAEYLVKLIEDHGAIIYACGDINKITNDILKTLAQCFCDVKNIQFNAAEEIVNVLKKDNRLIQDIWS